MYLLIYKDGSMMQVCEVPDAVRESPDVRVVEYRSGSYYCDGELVPESDDYYIH